MDWKQQLPRYGDARRELLQATVDEVSKYETVTEAASVMGIPIDTLKHRIRTAARDGIIPKYLEKKPVKEKIPRGMMNSKQMLDIVGEHKALIISDLHVPYHNHVAVEIACEEGYRQGCDVVLINGDFMDCADLSAHERVVGRRDGFFEVEVPRAREVLKAIAGYFPNARKLYKEGNHEYRMPRYLAKNSPELFDRDRLKKEVNPEMYGWQWVRHDVDIRLGRLSVIHGHEYRGSGGANPARALFLKASDNVLSGDKHRTAEYIHRTVKDKLLGAWVTGCLCDLSPDWLMKNQWNLGFAIVDIRDSGNFRVHNYKIHEGELL